MTMPHVEGFFDEVTFTVSYVVSDPATRRAVIIDPVLDFDPATGRTGTASADRLLRHVAANQLGVDWILDTHVHADHLTAMAYLRAETGARTGVGARVADVQHAFYHLFNLDEPALDAQVFDHMFDDNEAFSFGDQRGRVMFAPGHTAGCVAYLIGDACFVGDTLFMPDYGTARTDFPGADAGVLYDSIRRILSLPGATRLFMCHDYKAPGRDVFAWETTVAEQRATNVHINDAVARDEFVALRKQRDAGLAAPRLIFPALQVNIRAGNLPEPEDNGLRYLKIPLNAPT